MPTLQRRRMSYDAYSALPEEVRAEWVDGEVVVTPSPSFRHQRISFRLARLLDEGLPGFYMVEATSLHLPHNRERIPDLMVVDREPETPHVDFAPVLVAEILSSSTRSEDTVRKSGEYLAGGAGQYWIVDPADRSIDIFANQGVQWGAVARIDEASPLASVPVTAEMAVDVSLDAVLGATSKPSPH